MNSKLVMFYFLLLSIGLQAQIGPPLNSNQGNTIPAGCECLTFVSNCTGKEVTLINAKFTTTWCDGATTSRDYLVGETGQVCNFPNSKDECPITSVCIEGGDWEVCEIVGCEVRLKKTVSEFVLLNDKLLFGGGGPGTSSAFKFCERIHEGALNNIHGTKEILHCPGEEAILSIQEMSISATSGYCLTVNILKDNQVEVSQTYSSSETNGNSVDITDLLSKLATEETYVLEMIMACCDEIETKCTVNTRKYFYFKLLPAFSFTAMATDGAIPGTVSLPFTPATSPDGTILQNIFTIPISFPPFQLDLAAYTLTLSDVINSIGADVGYQYYVTNCTPNTNDDTAYGMGGSLTGENGQAFPVVVSSPMEGCTCYRLELEYDDGCSPEKVKTNYYFQVGPDCKENFTPVNPQELMRSQAIQSTSLQAKVKGNPVQEELILELFAAPSISSETIRINIYDISGKLVSNKIVDRTTSNVRITFEEIPGTYIYTIEAGGERLTGKFVKED